jgi:hypothetical protein
MCMLGFYVSVLFTIKINLHHYPGLQLQIRNKVFDKLIVLAETDTIIDGRHQSHMKCILQWNR